MKSQFLLGVLVLGGYSALTTVASAQLPTVAPPPIIAPKIIPQPNPVISQPLPVVGTDVRCEGTNTVAYKGSQRSVFISWVTNEFGYTPQERCQTVSSRLKAAVQGNGNKFSGLRLTSGTVNNRAVVCVLPIGQISCDSNNMLFTLNRKNEDQAGGIIGKLLNVGVPAAGTIYESEQQVVVDLGEWEASAFSQETAPENIPGNSPSPEQPAEAW